MAAKKLTLAQMRQAVVASAKAKKPARTRAELMKRLVVPAQFKDGVSDVCVTGLARLLTKKETTPHLIKRLRAQGKTVTEVSKSSRTKPSTGKCPFCKSANTTAEEGVVAAYVRCNDCLATGPYVRYVGLDPKENIKQFHSAAKLWNQATQ